MPSNPELQNVTEKRTTHQGPNPESPWHWGKGKRSLIDKYSLLVLNIEIVQEHQEAWTEEDITAGGQAIAKDIAAIWPRG